MNGHSFVRPLAALALLGGGVAVGAASTSDAAVATTSSPASSPGRSEPEPYQPVRQQPFRAPKGRYCSFAFRYRPTHQHLESRVLARYPDGTEKQIEYRGKLVGTTTNLSTGKRITRDSSGTAIEEYRHDGTLRFYDSYGPVGLGFTATDHYPKGYYQLGGIHRIAFTPDGTKRMALDAGREENICRTLG